MQDLFCIISETTIRTISRLIRGFGHFPLSSKCKSSSVNLSHSIKKVSTQSTLGLGQFLEEVEDELLGEDSKDTEVLLKQQQMSRFRSQAWKHTHQPITKKKHVNNNTSLARYHSEIYTFLNQMQ